VHFVASLRQLWRHRLFRRLVAVRAVAQTSDGMVQVGLASYVLFSPYQQPDGWSIATVLAITLLPFSVLGPFVSIVLDRWSRRQIMVITDSCRVVLALIIAALVGSGQRTGGVTLAIMLTALVAMSANRFVLAGLSSALPHTIEADEYLSANTIMPVIGPTGVVIGGGLAIGIRQGLGHTIETYQADALVFAVAAAGFATSAWIASGFARTALGPDHEHHHSAREVLVGLRAAVGHLLNRRPAAIGLATIGLQRVIFGVAMVGTILAYRNYFFSLEDVDRAMVALGLWAGATGVGFFLSTAVSPPMAAKLGMRRWMIIVLIAVAVIQVFPGSVFTQPTLVAASFLLGLGAQSLKICTDTLVQAHIDDTYKGRVFVLYDMVFNAALSIAAVIAALILPPNGVSVPMFLGLAGAYGVVAVLFAIGSGRIGAAAFDRGTESTRTA
jgi:MFS family permease